MSDKVGRYNPNSTPMVRIADGEYVHYEVYRRVKVKLAAETAALKRAANLATSPYYTGPQKEHCPRHMGRAKDVSWCLAKYRGGQFDKCSGNPEQCWLKYLRGET